ncbi:NAD(P)-binding protein [Lentinula lateritia]|uniref:NAD(P)-binding protein n=1 Tax=Lentinula lateritia TaxID=40482 RepID=A0ABQ8V4V7_9AGAR|nr:NAD(P)-binding protein [Lentinula lateritia]
MTTELQSSNVRSIFLLGATGYVGGQVLVSLAHDFPSFPIRALARNITPPKLTQLRALHSKLEVVEGSLSDHNVIEAEAKNADIVINVAAAGDTDSVNAIIRGLQQRSRSYTPTVPPIYIHMSGTGIMGDNARGELIVPDRLWVDTEFDLENIKTKLLTKACEAIVDAGKNGEIRTMIVFPGLIYGIGPGIQKISLPHRFYLNLAAQAGHSGSFGPGRNIAGLVHLKDVASAVSAVLEGALNGGKVGEKIGEGKEGIYFVLSKYMLSMMEFSNIVGDTLFKQGLISKTGSSPFSASIADKAGPFGYNIFGSSQFCRAERLTKELGWSAEHTETESLYDSLPKEIELAVKEMGLQFPKI